MNTRIDQLITKLGYSNDAGLLTGTSEFARAIGITHALHTASEAIHLKACYGVWETGFGGQVTSRFVPLVYLAQAQSIHEAKQYHRWVWSQGIVPWLIISVQEQFVICPGFDFSFDTNWEKLSVIVDAQGALEGNTSSVLTDFAAVSLRSSLHWRDFRIKSLGTVDKRLLQALEHLHRRLANELNGGGLSAATINRLIGRVLYTCLLLDRRIIPGTWAEKLTLDGYPSVLSAMAIDEFWALQDRIDDIFNGTVFELNLDQRTQIGQLHLDLTIDYLRKGTILQSSGEQTSLFDIDLTAIQIETLSAVYEEFLRSESPQSVLNDGVVYTPPFLVDFVVNRLDNEQEFSTESRVLDPTSGSGVFLVATFRRIVERTLAKRGLQKLPLEELRQILVGSIYGIEKAASAAAVAAFSLYLNLLEYADSAELATIVNERRRPKVFPPLIGTNILVADFFSKRHFTAVKFTCIAGNPPWKPLSQVTDIQLHTNDPVDGYEASEYITWFSLRQYLTSKGMLGLVMPSKSISSPSAKTFLKSLGQTFHIRAIVNLSHWRRHLFENAVQPAALLFVSASDVTHVSRTAFYSPALWTQPFRPKAMWTLAIDCSDVQWLPSAFVFRDQERIFDAYALRPLDRAAKNRLRQAVSQDSATTFAELLKQLGLDSAGGSTPDRTGLHPGEICSTKDFLKLKSGYAELSHHPKQLSDQRINYCHEQHRSKFQGERLLVSRSLAQAILIHNFPLAVNSSLNVIHWKNKSTGFTQSQRYNILAKLGRFLMSDFARFQFALFGRLWQVDRTRVERRDLDHIVVPRLEYFLSDSSQHQNFIEAMKLEDIVDAMNDYMGTRHQFENGQTPINANTAISKAPEDYLKILSICLHGSFGDLFTSCRTEDANNSSIPIIIEMAKPLPKRSNEEASNFQFYDTAHVTWSEGDRKIQMEKPAGSLYFSLDRAYSDAMRVTNLLMVTQ